MADTYDAIVLGGGPGGYVCAIRLAQLGQRVACVEGEEVGGVCLNWGCIPSKALISNAHLYDKAKAGAEVGLTFGELSLDVGKMQDWKGGIVKKLTGGVRGLLKSNGAELIEGMGRVVSSNSVEVQGADGSKRVVTATKGIVIATGSSTIQVPGFEFDGDKIIGAREAVSLRAIPKRLVVIGGGVIGLELGTVYQTFGSELTVLELSSSLLPGNDKDAVRIVQRHLEKRGAAIHTDTQAVGYRRQGDAVIVEAKKGGERLEIECDQVLVAVGMRPRSRGIGLEEVGVAISERGFVSTDDTCMTNVPGIYAIGDVSGPPMLAHKASKEGEVAAEVIAGHKAGKDWLSIPGIIFTDPEIAQVGMTAEAAKAAGKDAQVGRFPFSVLGRAMSIRETDGFVKVVRDKATDVVLGITICGPSASDLISEAVLAVEMAATATDIAMSVHPHPTLGEALMEASAASLGQAIHVPNR